MQGAWTRVLHTEHKRAMAWWRPTLMDLLPMDRVKWRAEPIFLISECCWLSTTRPGLVLKCIPGLRVWFIIVFHRKMSLFVGKRHFQPSHKLRFQQTKQPNCKYKTHVFCIVYTSYQYKSWGGGVIHELVSWDSATTRSASAKKLDW